MNDQDKYTSLQHQVRETVVRALALDLEPEQLEFDEPLFERGFGLDSVDMVSAIVAVEKRFSVEFPDDTDFPQRFRTIATIAKTLDLMRESGSVPNLGAKPSRSAADGLDAEEGA